jgi:ABC-type transporter Mla MlaB component
VSVIRSTPVLPVPGAPIPVDPADSAWPRRWRVSVSRRLSILVRSKPAAAPRAHGRSAARGPRNITLRASGDMTQWDAVQAFATKCAGTLQAGAAGKSAAAPVVIDLAQVDRADTKLIACLVCTLSTARQSDRAVQFRFSPAVQAWVTLCGLDAVLRPHA